MNDPSSQFADALAYNTRLAKLLQKLKRDAGAETIAQNYRGTGKQAFRRQLYVRFKSGAVIDLWLENNHIGFGGVVRNSPPGTVRPLQRGVAYGALSPEEVYEQTAHALGEWAKHTEPNRSR